MRRQYPPLRHSRKIPRQPPPDAHPLPAPPVAASGVHSGQLWGNGRRCRGDFLGVPSTSPRFFRFSVSAVTPDFTNSAAPPSPAAAFRQAVRTMPTFGFGFSSVENSTIPMISIGYFYTQDAMVVLKFGIGSEHQGR